MPIIKVINRGYNLNFLVKETMAKGILDRFRGQNPSKKRVNFHQKSFPDFKLSLKLVNPVINEKELS